MKKSDISDVQLIVGGVIPPDDVKKLKAMGVDAIFTPGAKREAIIRKWSISDEIFESIAREVARSK